MFCFRSARKLSSTDFPTTPPAFWPEDAFPFFRFGENHEHAGFTAESNETSLVRSAQQGDRYRLASWSARLSEPYMPQPIAG